MNIGMLLNAPYPSDLRVKKESSALIKAGHKVYLLCLRRKNENPTDVVDDMFISRIEAGHNNFQLAFWDIIMSVTGIHPRFKNKIKTWAGENNINVLHVHDLPLARTALSLRSNLNVKVIADFHENYPDALEAWSEWKKNWLADLKNKLFMNPTSWRKHERMVSLEADKVIAVVDEMKGRLISSYQVDPERIVVVSNLEEKSFTSQVEYPDIYKTYKDKFIITYSGNIGPHRGVDTVIEAMALLTEYPDIVFFIIGSGNTAVMNYLYEKVEKNNIQERVIFLGRQDFNKFFSYMKFASVNIIPHKSNNHTDNTIPHKLFQTMMTAKPVIVSSSAPLKRIVNQTNSGIVFEAGNPQDLALKIIELYKKPDLQMQLGLNGFQSTVEGTLNWDEEQTKLLSIYNDFSSITK